MLLIDAIYIHEGGAKVLLDYLMTKLEQTNMKVFYLLDDRIMQKQEIKVKSTNDILFLQSSFMKRVRFYRKYSSRFDSIFCIANVPPPIPVNSYVATYFHQSLMLDSSALSDLKDKLIFSIKKNIVCFLTKNTTEWIVQTNTIKLQLSEKFSLTKCKIKVIPFYPPLLSSKSQSIEKESNRFLYVSNAYAHKNHKNLIEAFCRFYALRQKGKLVLTVSSKYKSIYHLIKMKQDLGFPIINLQFVDRSKLGEEYEKAEHVSFTESFGLGLLEGIESGCKIIASDLPFVYAVCTPSLIFNPQDVKSIQQAFEDAIDKDVIESEIKIYDQINALISLFKTYC